MISRRLHLIEQADIYESMNMMVQFESSKLDLEYLNKSIILVKKRYPYLRMKIVRAEDETLSYVEQNETELKQTFLELFKLESMNEFNNWKSRFIRFGSKQRDTSKSIVFFDLFSFENKHQLCMSMNHSGNDGLGSFTVLNAILKHVDNYISGINANENIESRRFVDVHNELKHTFDIEALKSEPLLIDEFHKHLRFLNLKEESKKDADYLLNLSRNCEFFQLDESKSKELIQNAKKNKSSIQGVLSTAVTLSLMNEISDFSNLNEPVECLNSIPCNMRYLYEGLTNEDFFYSVALLMWKQKVKKADRVWDVAAQTTQSIAKSKADGDGLKWWVKFKHQLPTFENFSVLCSSVGVLPKDESLKNIKIEDLRFFNSAYNYANSTENFQPNYLQAHAVTFDNRFTFNISYTYPTLSVRWGQNFGKNLYAIIDQLAGKDSEELTVEKLGSILTKYN